MSVMHEWNFLPLFANKFLYSLNISSPIFSICCFCQMAIMNLFDALFKMAETLAFLAKYMSPLTGNSPCFVLSVVPLYSPTVFVIIPFDFTALCNFFTSPLIHWPGDSVELNKILFLSSFSPVGRKYFLSPFTGVKFSEFVWAMKGKRRTEFGFVSWSEWNSFKSLTRIEVLLFAFIPHFLQSCCSSRRFIVSSLSRSNQSCEVLLLSVWVLLEDWSQPLFPANLKTRSKALEQGLTPRYCRHLQRWTIFSTYALKVFSSYFLILETHTSSQQNPL